MYKALFIIALLTIGAFGNLKHDTKLVLAEMEKEEFGYTMLSAVQMNMAIAAPVEEIINLINSMVQGITQTVQKADEKNRTDQAECDTQINNLVREIKELTESISRKQAEITSKEELLGQDKISLAEAQHDYEETVRAIETGTAQRLSEHGRWADEDYQMSIDIATLEEGVRLINHMIHGVAFAQIKTRYDKVLEKLSENSSKHATLFKPLISTLTQLASKLNYENVMKILELLKNIRESIVADQEKSRQEEETAQHNWEVLLAQLTSTKQALQEKIQRLTNEIARLEEELTQTRASLASDQENLALNQDNLAATKAKCHELSVKYISNRSEYERQLEILGKLNTHLQERFSAVDEYIAGREAGAPQF